jgi:hydrogenase maturation protease
MIPKTLILGLGNPILSDDGVGLVVAGRIRGMVKGCRDLRPGITVLASPVTGIALLDIVLGYEHLFLIDAFLGEGTDAGELRIMSPSDPGVDRCSSHGFDLLRTLRLGRELNLPVPALQAVYGIVIRPDPPFGEELSPEVRGKTETLAEEISRHILLHSFALVSSQAPPAL